MNALIEMSDLFYGRPAGAATDEEVAAWYRAKGRLHERLATHGRADERAQELAYAAAAYEHARALLAHAATRAAVVTLPGHTAAEQPIPMPVAA